jgi:hypothetical protein
MKNPLENCPLGSQTLSLKADHLMSCIDEHRAAAAHLAAHLREIVKGRTCVAASAELRRLYQTLRDIERAHEMSRIAETKFESLIAREAGYR